MIDREETSSSNPDRASVPVDRLFEQLYEELRGVARHYMGGERDNHTLQPTALVHEAYMRLVASGVTIENRLQFLRLAARTMRRILVDHARQKGTDRRGGFMTRVTLTDDAGLAWPDIDLIDLDRALEKLEQLDERQASIVEMRFVIGLTVDEVAAELGVSPRTIKGDTRVAMAWLRRELS